MSAYSSIITLYGDRVGLEFFIETVKSNEDIVDSYFGVTGFFGESLILDNLEISNVDDAEEINVLINDVVGTKEIGILINDLDRVPEKEAKLLSQAYPGLKVSLESICTQKDWTTLIYYCKGEVYSRIENVCFIDGIPCPYCDKDYRQQILADGTIVDAFCAWCENHVPF